MPDDVDSWTETLGWLLFSPFAEMGVAGLIGLVMFGWALRGFVDRKRISESEKS